MMCNGEKYCHKKCGKFLLRIITGLVFLMHGINHFGNVDQTSFFFNHIGLSVFFVYLVSVIEVVGGIAFILGIFTRIFAFLFSIIMVFAVMLTNRELHLSSYELELMLFAVSVFFATTRSGYYSLTRFCKCKCHGKNKECKMCKVIGCEKHQGNIWEVSVEAEGSCKCC